MAVGQVAGGDLRQLAATVVRITSYNVCYTKLLRLVAVHTACRSLKSGECDMAIAGGISITIGEIKISSLKNAKELKSALDMSMVESRDDMVSVITSYSIHYTKLYD